MIAHSAVGKYVLVILLFVSFFGSTFSGEATEVQVVRNKGEGLWDADPGVGRHIDFIEDLVLGGEGKEHETFGRISDIAVDARGDIYILDFGLMRVHVFDGTGSYLLSFGHEGNGPGEFSSPSAIDIDAYDEVFIADRGEVDVFDLDGTYCRSFPIDAKSHISAIKKDGAGNLFISFFEVFDQNIIHKYDGNGKHLVSFCDSYAKGADVDVRIENVFAGGRFDIGKGDTIYFSQKLPYEIRKFDCQGNLLSRIYRENSFMRPPEDCVESDGENLHFTLPTFSSSIVALPNGMFINTVLAVDDAERRSSIIDVFDSEGRLLTTKTDDRPLFFTCSDGNGCLYAADNEERVKIIRFKVHVR